MNPASRTPRSKRLLVYSIAAFALLLAAFMLPGVARQARAAAPTRAEEPVPPPVPTAPPTMGTATPSRTAQPGSTATRTNTAAPGSTNTPGIPSPVPTGVATPCPISFNDVQTTDWFFEPVRWIVCGRVASGYSDGTFRPGNNTTRAQISKMVVLAAGWQLRNPTTPTFTDVAADSPFYAFIETAYSHGVVSGYSDGTFRPGSNVTRGQLSKIIVLARGWPLLVPDVATFSDVPVGSAFFSFVETAVSRTVVSGYTDGTFRVGSDATRAQLAKIIQRAYTIP